MITGAELLIKALKEEKVDTLFAYPGGQVIDLFDALYGEESIQVILPRHEQGLIHAADGYARSTGKVGVCIVTSGPGATNLVTGIATAHYDGVPLVCFTGQVSRELLGKTSFQEVDILSVTKSICKFSVSVQNREELAPLIRKAFTIAREGKKGVVVVDLPKDIQRELGSGDYLKKIETHEYQSVNLFSEENFLQAIKLLEEAKKPIFLIGGGVNSARAQAEMCNLAEITGVPVITTIMGKGVIPSKHDLYVGNIGIHGSYASNMAVSKCDVLFAIGTRFNDRITGNIKEFAPHAKIIHADIDANTISKNITADIEMVGDAKQIIQSLIQKAKPLAIKVWKNQIREWEHLHPIVKYEQGLTPAKIMKHINHIFEEVIIVTDVGQNQLWATQFLELNKQKRMLTSGGFGTMGYGFPAGLGAKIGNPQSYVVVITGDGGMQMNVQEMATAICYELPVIICVLNNGYLGNVRQWQELFFDKRYSHTCLRYRKSCNANCNKPTKHCPEYTPDFVKLAESYGAKGIRVTKEEEIKNAFEIAKRGRTLPTVIEFIMERESNVLPIIPPGNALHDMLL